MMPADLEKWPSDLVHELGNQAFVSLLYALGRNNGGLPLLSGVTRTTRGYRVEFHSTTSESDAKRFIIFSASTIGKGSKKSVPDSKSDAGSGHNIEFNIDSKEFLIHVEGDREIIEKIAGLPQKLMEEYLAASFPFPSFSAMSPFQRFLCMTHGLSVSSPVRRSLILESSVAEMSLLTLDETREEVRRSNSHALSLMISSKAVIENAKGVHLPQSLNEFMKRYRTRLIPYLLRIRKSTIFDFEK